MTPRHVVPGARNPSILRRIKHRLSLLVASNILLHNIAYAHDGPDIGRPDQLLRQLRMTERGWEAAVCMKAICLRPDGFGIVVAFLSNAIPVYLIAEDPFLP